MSASSTVFTAVPRSARSLEVYQVTLELIARCQAVSPHIFRFNRRLDTMRIPGAAQSPA